MTDEAFEMLTRAFDVLKTDYDRVARELSAAEPFVQLAHDAMSLRCGERGSVRNWNEWTIAFTDALIANPPTPLQT